MRNRISSILLLLAFIVLSNTSKSIAQRKEAIHLNDKGVKIYMDVLGLKLPKDSMKLANNYYRMAIAKDKTYKVPYINFWNSSNYLNDYSSSIDICNKWLSNNPKDVDFLIKRGMLYELLKKNEMADSDFIKSITLMDALSYPLDKPLTLNQTKVVSNMILNLFIVDKKGHILENFKSKLKSNPSLSPEIKSILQMTNNTSRRKYIVSINNYFDKNH